MTGYFEKRFVSKVPGLFRLIFVFFLRRLKRFEKAVGEWLHKQKMLRFYGQFIKKGDLCFDIGANMGSRTKAFLKLGSRVVCVEPQETCLQVLYKELGNDKNAVIVGKAVGRRVGYGEIAICEDAPTISTMSNKWENEGRFSKNYNWTERQQVCLITLDSLILEYGLPRLCAIDVEGFENEVLSGLTKRIPYIYFEFTVEFFDDAKKCINYLLQMDYVKFNCSIEESMKFLLPTWVNSEELYKKINLLEDNLLWGYIFARFP